MLRIRVSVTMLFGPLGAGAAPSTASRRTRPLRKAGLAELDTSPSSALTKPAGPNSCLRRRRRVISGLSSATECVQTNRTRPGTRHDVARAQGLTCCWMIRLETRDHGHRGRDGRVRDGRSSMSPMLRHHVKQVVLQRHVALQEITPSLTAHSARPRCAARSSPHGVRGHPSPCGFLVGAPQAEGHEPGVQQARWCKDP